MRSIRTFRTILFAATQAAALGGLLAAGPAQALDTQLHGGSIIFVADNATPVKPGATTAPSAGKSAQPVSDSVITVKVKAELAAAKGLESRHISVKTVNGTVHLTGSVPSEAQRTQAIQTVRGIEGVSSVADGLTVGGKS